MNATNDLLSRCLYGEATAADWQLLDEQIAADPMVARRWCEDARLDAELCRLLAPKHAARTSAKVRIAAFAAAAALVAAGIFTAMHYTQSPPAFTPSPAPAQAPADPAPVSKTAEDEAFDACELLFAKSKYADALVHYALYLERYPDGKHREDAVFKIGECHYQQEAWAQALKQYELYRRDFPKGRHHAAAHYHTGESHYKLASRGAPDSRAEHTRMAGDAYRASMLVSATGPFAAYSAFRLGSYAYNSAMPAAAAQYAEAARWFAIAAAQAPKDQARIRATALYFLNRCQRELMQRDEAVVSLKELLKIKAEENVYLEKAREELSQLESGSPGKDGEAEKKDSSTPPAPAAPAPAKFSRVTTEEKVMALTFDDGPHGENTPRLLKMLKDEGVKATFFPVGFNVERFPELAKQTAAAGHELGNHSWSHPMLSRLPEDKFRAEIESSRDKLREITGRNPDLFRPPYGAITAAQVEFVTREYGCSTVLWSVDSMDWKSRNAEAVKNAVIKQAVPGAIILLHEIHSTTIDAIPEILRALKADGWKFVTITELTKLGSKVNTGIPATGPEPEAESAPEKKDQK